MAAAKIEAMWDQDAFGNHLLIISKKRGKLNLEEVGDFLRYSTSGRLQGHYVVVINATEATCGAQWGFDEAPQGDTWELCQVEEGERCPVCSKITPPYQYCPECGAELSDHGKKNEQALKRAEKVLKAMEDEALRMIHTTELPETRKAWYQSHLGSVDFARQMGLITEERRQQLYKEFEKAAR